MTTAVKTVAEKAALNGHAGAKITYEEIPVRDIQRFDEEATQRPLIDAWVRKLMRDMDLDSLGTLTIWRTDGRNVCLDGGHRLEALLRLDMRDWPIRCVVYHDINRATAAGLFRRLNNRRKVNAIEDFLKGIAEGDGECVVINRIAKRVGLKVDRQVGPGKIACVAAMRRVYNGRGSAAHPKELELALTTATDAWGHTPEAVDGQIVHGLGEFFKRYGKDVDAAELVPKLAKIPGGPSRLLGNARSLHEMTSRPVYRCVVEVVVGLYNKSRRTGVLPPL